MAPMSEYLYRRGSGVESDGTNVRVSVQERLRGIFGVGDLGVHPLALVVGVGNLLRLPLALELRVVNHGCLPFAVHLIVPVVGFFSLWVGDMFGLVPILRLGVSRVGNGLLFIPVFGLLSLRVKNLLGW